MQVTIPDETVAKFQAAQRTVDELKEEDQRLVDEANAAGRSTEKYKTLMGQRQKLREKLIRAANDAGAYKLEMINALDRAVNP